MHPTPVPSKIELDSIRCEKLLNDQTDHQVQIIHQESTLRPGVVKHAKSDQSRAMRHFSNDQRIAGLQIDKMQLSH